MIRKSLLLLPALVLLTGCPTDDTWDQLNESGECFEVVVSPDAVADDDDSAVDDDDSAVDDDDSAVDDDDDSAPDDFEPDIAELLLHSRAGFFDIDVIGTATLGPTSGPAGTDFTIVIVLEDTGTDQGNPTDVVTRATIQVDNGAVTLNEFDLSESPADERRWSGVFRAGGTADTRRTDEVCVALYTED